MYRSAFLLSIFLFLAKVNLCLAQKIEKQLDPVKVDSIQIKGERFLFLGDDVYYIPRDTTIAIADTTDYYVRKESLGKSESFYDSLEMKMSRNKMASMVYDAIFVDPNKENKVRDEEVSEMRFMAFEDHVASPVHYKRLAVFGTSFNDTTKYDVDIFTGTFNKLHISTQRWVIKRNLTFKEGDYIDPQEMIDSERLLRSRRFIRDARIIIAPEHQLDSAKVIVISRDVFPWAVSIRPNNGNRALFGLSTANLAGLGHELEYNYISGNDGGSEIFYRVNNIFGLYTDLNIDLASFFRKTGAGLIINRAFLTQETKYAGGLEISSYKYGEYSYDPISDITSQFNYNTERFLCWLGRSFQMDLHRNVLGFKGEANFTVTASFDDINIIDKPEVRIDTNYAYHDRRQYLTEFGLTSRNYYKDKFVINYGRTEDIPTGSAIGMVTGYEQREFENRAYIGFNFAKGGYNKQLGYLNGIVSLGSFHDGRRFEDGVFNVGLDYFSNLRTIGRFRWRQFINLSFSHLLRPTEDIFIRGQNDIGIRGLNSYYLRGTSLTNMRFETMFFTPFNALSFRMAVFGFFDGSIVGNNMNSLIKTEMYSGFGLGLRFSNDNLAVSTLTVRLTYFPNTPINAQPEPIQLSTSNRLNFRDFDIEQPGIISFR
ncbi:hypothetical protein [Reichenbachiella ulvae]|uniref:Outer membrane protein assembly factor BamA n=1 Tax=Reichenbachiella ulvae TaxID=2980104 RepID=A0ABT3CXG7_9BACT|nr:hypothetical protein [Reichenbachiella ulvae]MCV9388398.1 hypothetical protein [Reichenbachiella ulvae]